ncbi:hypothetical protein MNEG_5729 [Monoraphidium neglectum]|uniref:SGNH hydrolase-type esterase domain-containing protein n=1 Tax=Monoraphidium neglectum TaxID=145388 RepID=A0A0D2L5C4_9CHLO|nr:hypothetical protein MNEG_5729 [Monoraphidium neglectum]KIZ02234.1 hypothetical protein MNEG_5729 [Monoraphidium neglectum]|eukprot:XP_013901253.1 hypothetical protein MNEG_5729 [Monoraphidium neglectum]
MAIAPLPAPGFVSKDDVKEAERVKLNEEIKKIGVWWNTNHPDGPTFLFTDLGFDGPMDFWKMSIAERAQWLDDGLHLTPKAYDKMGDFIANALLPHLKK